MELLALDKPIKKPPRSDERDGDLFCGTAKEVYTRFSYFAGYDLENERTISQTSAYTVNGNYISITRNTQQTGYTITCTIPCTVRYYSTNGLVREHVLTSVSQTATGLFEDESIGSWVVF